MIQIMGSRTLKILVFLLSISCQVKAQSPAKSNSATASTETKKAEVKVSDGKQDDEKTKITRQRAEKGNASYYSSKLTGRKTANGELYNADSLTCAHKKYPFGTKLRVYNPSNGKEVIVRVTDRGPFRKNFITDLSYSAAKKIGILRAGFMPVEVTVWHGDDFVIPYKVDQPDLPELDMGIEVDTLNYKPVWQRNDSTALRKITDAAKRASATKKSATTTK